MRAPSLARMAAVAAPRPDAEPVTIAHKPSFDIRISPDCCSAWPANDAIYHIVRKNACKSAKLRCAEFSIPARSAACRPRRAPCGHRRLSWQWLFLIMRCKKRPRPKPEAKSPDGMRAVENEERRGE